MAETDQKAGFCMNCRSGSHGLCMSAKCTCPDRRKHRSRPSYGSTEPQEPPERIAMNTQPARPLAPVPTPPQPKPAAAKPVLQRVEEDPPEPEVRRTLIAEVLDLVNGIEPGRWYRVAVMPSSRSAKGLVTRLAKHEVTVRGKLEWRASGDRVYVRGPE